MSYAKDVCVMSQKLDEARASAHGILALGEKDVTNLFFEAAMRRNLSRTVRQLDRLLASGGDDKALGEQALKRLGFPPTLAQR